MASFYVTALPLYLVFPLMRKLALTAALFSAFAFSVAKAAPPVASTEEGITPQWLYQFLIAEIAAQRGQYSLSAGAYVDLAKATRHPRIARRAAEVSLHTRQFDLALDAARLWNDLEPNDPAARQMLSNLYVATNRIDDLATALAKDLAAAGPQLDEQLMRLNRLFARYPDKLAVQRLVEQVTLPYIARPEAHFARAQAALSANQPDRATSAIDRALELRPDWEQAALLKAQQLARGPELVSFLERFVAANPRAAELRLSYARALVGEKRYAESRHEFRLLLESYPENTDVLYAVGVLSLQLDEPAEAEPRLRKLLELGQGDLNPPRFYLGQIAEEAKRLDEALQFYDAVESGEHRVAALLRGSQILAKQGKVDAARQRLESARGALPAEVPRLLIAESQLLREAGRNDEALGVLRTSLDQHPDNPELLYEVALAAERADRIVDAERYLRRLIEIKPDSAQGYNALGYSLADRSQRLDEAQRLIDKALSLAPDDPFILDSKGWLLFRQGNFAAALEALQKAYAQKPDAEIAAHVGEVLWALGRPGEALAVWREATKAHPNNEVLAATIKRFVP
jgi:tetratricopeptide (TPR) repeat protein